VTAEEPSEDPAFKLTEVDPNGELVETPAELAKRLRAEQDELDAQEWEENMILLEKEQEDYTTYPDQPIRRYFPVPFLMH
jgi:hypothetical protein